MKTKSLITLAVVAVLSAQCVHATTNITGATQNGHVYTIKPEKAISGVAYRHYTDFSLDSGDIANLNFTHSDGVDREAFINLVDKQVNIGGILNSVKGENNAFHNGHAIFISPNGLVVGASGVLNVGRLSVATPASSTYESLTAEYASNNVKNINKVSQLKKTGNGEINIAGTVLTNRGADFSGSKITVGSNAIILNGALNQEAFTTKEDADALFNDLVNTSGTAINGSELILRNSDVTNAGMSIAGKVINLDTKSNTSVINKGSNGLSVAGTAQIAGKGDTTGLFNYKGAMNVYGKVNGANKTTLSNKSSGAMTVGTGSNITGKDVQLANKSGSSMALENGSQVQGTNAVYITNKKGALDVAGTVKTTANNGKVSIYNRGNNTTTLNIASTSKIDATGGNLLINNFGTGNTNINGTVKNTSGMIAINNRNKGNLTVDGTVETTNKGNIGILNRATDGKLTINSSAEVKTDQKAKIQIINLGSQGMTLSNPIDSAGDINIVNNAGKLKVENSLTARDGNLFVKSRRNATGLLIDSNDAVLQASGNLAILNDGTATNNSGLVISDQASIESTSGEVAINNYKGKLQVGQADDSDPVTITAKNNLGIINRAGGSDMDVFATIVNTGANKTTNIKQNGSGNMNVGGTITHAGRVNVLDNTGKLTLTSKVNNNGGYFYATSRQNGTGIEVGSAFNGSGTGTFLIKNISGANGLKYDGTINSNGGQAALVNKKGDMVVNGTVKSTGNRAIIRNTGGKVTMNQGSKLESNQEAFVVNTGTSKAVLNGTITSPKTPVLYEEVKE